MPKSIPNERIPQSGPLVGAVSATSALAANAVCSAQLGAVSATQSLGLTLAIVTSTGATAAACTTFQITGLNTTQIAGGQITAVFGVPAGAGVPATPLVLKFDPPLMAAPGSAINAQIGALGSGHAAASINLIGKVMPVP